MAAPAMITTLDEFETEYRKGVGHVMPPRGEREASLDNIRRFGDGIGDYNPAFPRRGLRRAKPVRDDGRARRSSSTGQA